MTIIGTAGHVDHGKSTLIEALTGINPDRLPEERRRGMTLDLGFAHLDLPSGQRVGIVDVPGHARFLPNMLAGVHGMDGVLLVVAADEGVMPQTREHLDVIQLLGIDRLVVALTKVDLVDEAFADLAAEDVHRELASRGLSAPLVQVVAPASRGLEAMVEALSVLVAETRPPDDGRPRLPVDRAFTRPGFGLVVTGSLVDGGLREGQELELVPGLGPRGRRVLGARPQLARVRSLQQHGRGVTAAPAGVRLAVNLQGLGPSGARRGQVLAPPGTLHPTGLLDVELHVLAGAPPLRHNAPVRVHAGTSESGARLVLLEAAIIEPGGSGWAQLVLAEPLAVRDGDRIVLRQPSPALTLGGGVIADAAPPRRRAGQAGAAAALRRRVTDGGRLGEELAKAERGLVLEQLAERLGAAPGTLADEVEHLVATGEIVPAGPILHHRDRWMEIERAAVRELAAFHRSNPLRIGMLAEELLGRLRAPRDAHSSGTIATLVGRGTMEQFGSRRVGLPGFAPRLTAAQERAAGAVMAALEGDPLAPPAGTELVALGLDDELRGYLEESGQVVRLAPGVLIAASALTRARELLADDIGRHGPITVARARDVLGSSRRTVVPLLEYLDATHFTRREGETRVLRSPPQHGAP